MWMVWLLQAMSPSGAYKMDQADNKSSNFLLSAYCHGLLSACKPMIIIILFGKSFG